MRKRLATTGETETLMTSHLYVIILAAGEGSRVRNLTKSANGDLVPKQFSVADGHRSMLSWTLHRAMRLVPTERIVVVVAKQHEVWWRNELAELPTQNIVMQPLNRGTAVGFLLPFLKVLQRDPEARILVLPSDHYVDDEEALRLAILEGLEAVRRDRSRVVLLGAIPEEPDTEYGWIVPTGPLDRVRAVATFVEKPDEDNARKLMNRGAVLNTLIAVADGRSLLQLYTKNLPELLGELVAWRDDSDASDDELEQLYQRLPAHDLSRDVLRLSCDDLSVLLVSGCGWSDLGTPARLQRFQRQQVSAATPVQSYGLSLRHG